MKKISLSRFKIAICVLVILTLTGFILSLFLPATEESGARSNRKDPQKVLSIGLLLSKTAHDNRSPIGLSMERGALTAETLINNSGGILGRHLKIITLYIDTNPQKTFQAITELFNQKGISLIIGTQYDQETFIAAQAAQSLNLPFIYPLNGNLKTCQQEDPTKVNDTTWTLSLSPEMNVEPLLIYLADKIVRPEENLNVYYFTTDEAYYRSSAQFVIDLAESLSFQTVGEEYIDPRIKDYFQNVREIFGKKPDLLFVTTSPLGTELFMRQAAKLGVKKDMIVAGLEPFTLENTEPLANDIDGVYTASNYSPFLENQENQVFLDTWHKLYPKEKDPSPVAAAVYSSLLIAREAFTKAQKIEAKAFLEALEKIEIKLPQGRVLANPQNHSFIMPLYALRFNGTKPEIAEYLGEVSHPGLQNCQTSTITGEKKLKKEIDTREYD